MSRYNGTAPADMSSEEFANLTMGELYDMVEQSEEKLFQLSINGEDGKPFAMFMLAVDTPEVLERYAKAVREVKPTILSAIGAKLHS